MNLTETAYAKINLALHVRGRREDGYHELETLFAFVDVGDTLQIKAAAQNELLIDGEFGAGLSFDADNLVMKAINAFATHQSYRVLLTKNLPVAAGVGGGSADAAAAFRAIVSAHATDKTFGLPVDYNKRLAKLGADVPACVESRTCIGRGTGTELEPADDTLKGTPVLLINPRIPLSTGPVFKAWDGQDRGPLSKGTARDIAENGRNDLRAPAINICPQISDVLDELSRDTAWKVEMSGSGATCFALYSNVQDRDDAARRIAEARPDWWQMTGRLR